MCDAYSYDEPANPPVVVPVAPVVPVVPAIGPCWGPPISPVTRARFTIHTEKKVSKMHSNTLSLNFPSLSI
jgi:hypothetical protein